LFNQFSRIPILSIPLVLFYGSIYVVVTGWREHSALGQVSPRLGTPVLIKKTA
jgi:hypothetical protein